jgi:hypothetical protein
MLRSTPVKITDFALPDDEMFVETLILRIFKQKEIRFDLISGNSVTGFVTALDKESIQIITTQDQRLGVVNIMNLEYWEETGWSLKNVPIHFADEVVDEALRQKISPQTLVDFPVEERENLRSDICLELEETARSKIVFYSKKMYAKARALYAPRDRNDLHVIDA